MSAPSHPTDRRAAEGGGHSADGSVSWPSKNNRQGPHEGAYTPETAVAPDDLPDGTGLRPLSVEPERRLRNEAVHELSDGPQARPWYAVLSEWRDWYDGYLRSNIEFDGPDGETVRTELENSYMPKYGKRYYAKLKDFERGVAREFDGMTTAMLTLTASHRNEKGGWRCPADHMRDIMDGYDAARKQLHQVLSGRKWEYARVWEPHADGYGHLHIAVFVEDDGDADLRADDFEPVMRSHVENCGPAGSKAHDPAGDSVSVRDDVENLGSYISEYIGIFGDETLNRPMTEQMFYAVTWATNTRRVDFSNGAQDLMSREQFRRETGLKPEDRGGESLERWKETGDPDGDTGPDVGGWEVTSICTVNHRRPEYADPTTGGVETTAIRGRSGVDPPPQIQ
uniref:Replication initiation protein n=1 Tax=Haloferax sp. (strain Q22) TaxID=1526048 RepID=A0A0H3YBU0_HALS0|nr:hypothetical protein [Haloferax sp. Q22]AKN10606.1 replication initiation protein [Haloferax sp. Q22]